jgi:dihydroorotate dehydrogenase (NAD+) catalytic subunit
LKASLKVKLGRISLNNPVLVAAGTFGYGEEYARLIDLNKLGGIMSKTVTVKPRRGNPPPRLVETPAGLLNAIGLENPGIDIFLKEKLPFLCQFKTALIVNIGGEKEEDYLNLAERLSEKESIDALEINISCPNVKEKGLIFGTDAGRTFSLVKKLREVTNTPLIVKLTPNVTDISEIAQAAEEAGAEALSLINTILGMSIDVETRRPKLANITGGLSGPAIRPIAVRMVRDTFQRVSLPIIGMGGITCSQDALEFILAGASAVAVGTANFIDFRTAPRIVEGIKQYMQKKRIDNFKDLIGWFNMD